MKALILTAAATLFTAGAAFAADDMMNTKQMTKAECDAAMAACKDDTCKEQLKTNNGCTDDKAAQ